MNLKTLHQIIAKDEGMFRVEYDRKGWTIYGTLPGITPKSFAVSGATLEEVLDDAVSMIAAIKQSQVTTEREAVLRYV